MILINAVLQQLYTHLLVLPSGVGPDSGDELIIENMRERTVAKVVAETSKADKIHLPLRDAKARLIHAKFVCPQLGEMGHTERMLEAVVRGTRKYKVCAAELLEVSQALELRCVHNLSKSSVELDEALDGVHDYLGHMKRFPARELDALGTKKVIHVAHDGKLK